MQLKQLLNDDDAVSPVIGVILMVAITVILAAVIGTFVLGLGDQVQDTAPNANMDFDYNGAEKLEATQTGGQGIEYTAIGISVDGTMYYNKNTSQYEGGTGVNDGQWFTGDGKTSAGDSVVLNDSTSAAPSNHIDIQATNSQDFDSVEEVRIVWRSGDQSSTIQTWTN